MWIPLAVFLGVLVLIVGMYWLFILRDESKFLGRLSPRIAAEANKNTRGILKAERRMSSVDRLDKLLSQAGGVTGPIKLFIEQSGMKLTVATFLLSSATAGLAGYFIAALLSRRMLVGLIVGVAGLFLPYLVVRRSRNKRLLKFEEQFPEAIDLIARALRAGHALPTGLNMVADEMPDPVGSEFRTLYEEQNFGLTLPDALRNFATRIAVLDARFFVTAVMTQREAGGNLAEVLDNLSAVIRERFKIKRQVRVISAHGRITGWILACLPPSVAALSFVLSPSHLNTLLGDDLGIKMIWSAVIMQILGTLIIRKIVNVEY
jgi:tight adherence protein B